MFEITFDSTEETINADFDSTTQAPGGGGTYNYNDLTNKPQIAGVALQGNKSLADLGIAAASDIPSVPVQSVNGKTGAVELSASDVGALPSSTAIPTKTSELSNDSGFITSADVPAAATSVPANLGTAAVGSSGDFARADHVHNKPTYSKSDVGLGNVDNIQQYSANNPPPYPVSSVNGQTGAVSLSIPSTASDVGAVAVAQGVGHAGEFLVVGSDGNVTTVTLATWQGGSY